MTHPCHKDQLASINRIEGQIRGISRMIDDGKYCIDILDQLKAAKNSIKSVEAKILKTHLKECVKETLAEKSDFDTKVEEILKVLDGEKLESSKKTRQHLAMVEAKIEREKQIEQKEKALKDMENSEADNSLKGTAIDAEA